MEVCATGLDTRPYTVTSLSGQTRQRFQVRFGFARTGPQADFVEEHFDEADRRGRRVLGELAA